MTWLEAQAEKAKREWSDFNGLSAQTSPMGEDRTIPNNDIAKDLNGSEVDRATGAVSASQIDRDAAECATDKAGNQIDPCNHVVASTD